MFVLVVVSVVMFWGGGEVVTSCFALCVRWTLVIRLWLLHRSARALGAYLHLHVGAKGILPKNWGALWRPNELRVACWCWYTGVSPLVDRVVMFWIHCASVWPGVQTLITCGTQRSVARKQENDRGGQSVLCKLRGEQCTWCGA